MSTTTAQNSVGPFARNFCCTLSVIVIPQVCNLNTTRIRLFTWYTILYRVVIRRWHSYPLLVRLKRAKWISIWHLPFADLCSTDGGCKKHPFVLSVGILVMLHFPWTTPILVNSLVSFCYSNMDSAMPLHCSLDIFAIFCYQSNSSFLQNQNTYCVKWWR